MERGVCRWTVDLSTWHPPPQEFSSLPLSSLGRNIPPFVRMEDRKRELVSLLRQYILVSEVVGIPYRLIVIKRTPENGFIFSEGCYRNPTKFPSFNFNVSHHGDYVGISIRTIATDRLRYGVVYET
ncbi:hypothetical protein MLD38_003767 [Melastoma candidum]|uniref:Uncharacterized protein n=1 Tax=Melastoma candidum TaxID=119954 RepID=A0ACB9S7I1_9MYRT|nr:hypothetical protein MLD38_003767 [Melastoma candidum]